MKNARNDVGGLLVAAWSTVVGCCVADVRLAVGVVGTEVGSGEGDGLDWVCVRVAV
jgi:hypothetical protein